MSPSNKLLAITSIGSRFSKNGSTTAGSGSTPVKRYLKKKEASIWWRLLKLRYYDKWKTTLSTDWMLENCCPRSICHVRWVSARNESFGDSGRLWRELQDLASESNLVSCYKSTSYNLRDANSISAEKLVRIIIISQEYITSVSVSPQHCCSFWFDETSRTWRLPLIPRIHKIELYLHR